jgi:ribosomal protein S8
MSSFKNAVINLVESLKFYEVNKVLVCTKSKYMQLRYILKILIKHGVILNYVLRDNKLFINVNHLKHYSIKYFSKSKYLSSYKIESLVHKFPGNIFIISTSSGIIDSTEAVFKGIGGQLLLILKTKESLIKTIK